MCSLQVTKLIFRVSGKMEPQYNHITVESISCHNWVWHILPKDCSRPKSPYEHEVKEGRI